MREDWSSMSDEDKRQFTEKSKVEKDKHEEKKQSIEDSLKEEVKKLFEGLDYVESLLEKNKFLLGDEILECDLRLIPTLLRFDPVYVGHFKCNLKRIWDYPKMREYLENFKKIDGMMELTNIDHIKTHYYGSHKEINPSGIIPLGPISF